MLKKLKIDTSYTEPEGKPSMFNTLGMIHKLNISIKTKDNKWKQVEVTEIFVTDEPEQKIALEPRHKNALILGWPWFQANVENVNFENKTFTLKNSSTSLAQL
nr:2144_t:CDS:2 [Entrophospora candida]